MIRGIDITELINSGDQSSLNPRVPTGDGSYTLKSIYDALAANSTEPISKGKEQYAKDFLSDSMDSLYSRNLKRDGRKPSSSLMPGESLSDDEERMAKFMSRNVYGAGSAVLYVEASIIGSSSVDLDCSGLIGNGSLPLTADGQLILASNIGIQANLTSDGTIQNTEFSITDYRWASDDISYGWYDHASPSAFTSGSVHEQSWGDIVWLAVRLRLSPGLASVDLTGNDWNLYFTVDGAGTNVDVPWTQVTTTSDYFRLISNPLTTNRLPDNYQSGTQTIPNDYQVTRPGPGRPDNDFDIKIALSGAESPTIFAESILEVSEIEVWYPLQLFEPGGSYSLDQGSEISFKLESLSLTSTGTNIVRGNSTTNTFWWANAVS